MRYKPALASVSKNDSMSRPTGMSRTGCNPVRRRRRVHIGSAPRVTVVAEPLPTSKAPAGAGENTTPTKTAPSLSPDQQPAPQTFHRGTRTQPARRVRALCSLRASLWFGAPDEHV